MPWSVAAAGTIACLVVLAADSARRWGQPSFHGRGRGRPTLAVLCLLAALILAVNVID